MTKIIITAGAVAVLAVAAVLVVKHLSSPVKDAYFDPDTDKLRNLPAGLVVVRATHFPQGTAKTREIKDGEDVTRVLGRNVKLQDVIGTAWDCNPARVVLPANAPSGGFDFLVTTATDAREHLQTAVRKKLGYTARRETRDTEVWVLKVENSGLPGLTVSPENATPGATVKEGKLFLRHQRLSAILGGLSQGLNRPVVDKTGLDGFYDFAVPWTPHVQEHLQNGAFDPEGVKKFLGSLGLKLEPDTESQEMYVVERAG